MKKDINITVKVDTNSLDELRKFNIKSTSKMLDLKHLPFNKFLLITSSGKISEEEAKGFIEDISRNVNVSDRVKERMIEDYRNNQVTGDLELNVCVEGRDISIRSDKVFNLRLKLKEDIVDASNIPEYLEDFHLAPDSETLNAMIQRDENEKKRFEEFTYQTITNVFHLLLYMSTSEKYDIEKEDLYSTREVVEKAKPKKSKNGKKKKNSNTSIIKNTVIEIPREKVLRNTQRKLKKLTYERHTEEWFTKGFWRTYKSGKRVWIEPGIRKARNVMPNSNESIEKIYVVK